MKWKVFIPVKMRLWDVRVAEETVWSVILWGVEGGMDEMRVLAEVMRLVCWGVRGRGAIFEFI